MRLSHFISFEESGRCRYDPLFRGFFWLSTHSQSYDPLLCWGSVYYSRPYLPDLASLEHWSGGLLDVDVGFGVGLKKGYKNENNLKGDVLQLLESNLCWNLKHNLCPSFLAWGIYLLRLCWVMCVTHIVLHCAHYVHYASYICYNAHYDRAVRRLRILFEESGQT